MLSSAGETPTNELKKARLDLFVQKAPVTGTVGLTFLRAAEQSLLLPGAEDAVGSEGTGIWGGIHQQWWMAASQCWEVGWG